MYECPTGRGSGQTQWMVDHLIESLQMGQPRCCVWARDAAHLSDIMHRVLPQIEVCIEKPIPRGPYLFSVGDAMLKFGTASEYDRWRQGTRGWGEFWDHAAVDYYMETHDLREPWDDVPY